jgi:DNA-binding NtrC family response regulator
MTDQVMPDMSGTALAETAKAAHPDLRVIVAAGYAEAPQQGGVDCVRVVKPCRQEDLAKAISDACGNEAPAFRVLRFPMRAARGGEG